MAIGLSHGGSNVYAAPRPSRELWVATQDGLVLFEHENGEWRENRPALRGQHISAIVFEPARGTIFAGSFFGSIHASSDRGKTWERRDNGMTIHDVYSLATTSVDGQVRLYAGTQPAHLLLDLRPRHDAVRHLGQRPAHHDRGADGDPRRHADAAQLAVAHASSCPGFRCIS